MISLIPMILLFWVLAIYAGASSVVSISDDVSVAVALFLVVSVFAVVRGYIGLVRERRVALAIFLFSVLFMFAWPAARMALSNDWYGEKFGRPLRPDILHLAVAHISLFGGTVLFAYLIGTRLFGSMRGSDADVAPIARVRNLFALLGVAVALYYASNVGSLSDLIGGILGSRAAEKPWKQTELVGDAMSPLWIVSRVALVGLAQMGLTVLAWQPKYWRRHLGSISVGAIALIVTYFDTGTRSWVALATLGPMFVWLQRHAGRLAARRLVAFAAAATLLFAAAAFQRLYRTVGSMSDVRLEVRDLFTIVDNDFFTEAALAIDAGATGARVDEDTALLFLSNPIPRFMWKNKPLPETQRFYTWYIRGYDMFERGGGNSLPSVVGQFYLKGGSFGVVAIAIVYGGFLSLADKFARGFSQSPLVVLSAASVAAWLFLGCRGLYPGFHYGAVFPIVVTLTAALHRRYFKAPMEGSAAANAQGLRSRSFG